MRCAVSWRISRPPFFLLFFIGADPKLTTGDESDAIIENSDSDMETEPANFRANRSPSVKQEPSPVDWSIVSSSESLASDGETGSESDAASAKSDGPIKTERTPSTSPPLVRQHLHQHARAKVGAQAGAVATRRHWLGHDNNNKNRLPVSLDPQINDRIMDLMIEITRYRLAFPDSERWFAPEEELLEILRAQNMSYKHIAKVGNY